VVVYAERHQECQLDLLQPEKPVTIPLDTDVLDWFKMQAKGYQTKINKLLRGDMGPQEHRR
jgi:uncharacterized protein (DUF4415 family)